MSDNVTRLHPVRPEVVQVATAVSLAIDGAELFAYSLDEEDLASNPQRAAYLLGLAEAHIISLVAIIRAVKR